MPLPKFEIRGLHNDVAQDLSRLGSFAMSAGKQSPACRKIIVPSSSGSSKSQYLSNSLITV